MDWEDLGTASPGAQATAAAHGLAPALALALAAQLAEQRAAPHARAAPLISDYMHALESSLDSSRRAQASEREAGEQRQRAESLSKALAAAEAAGASSAASAELESRLGQAQEELSKTYKEKADLAASALRAQQQLDVVRGIGERQAAELAEAASAMRALRQQQRAAQDRAEAASKAQAELAAELAAREEALRSAETAREAATIESNALARRLVELKEREIERMNEINALRDDMLGAAKRAAAELLASARASAALAGQGRGGGTRLVAPATGAGGQETSPTTLGQLHGAQAALPSRPQTASALHQGGCFGLGFSRNGGFLVSGGADKAVRLWDATSAAVTATLQGAFEGVNAVAVSCDGAAVLAAENRAAVHVWRVAGGRLAASLTGHTGRVGGVAASPLEAGVALSASADRTIKVWGLEKGFCARTILCPSTCHAVGFVRDATLIASGHWDGTLRFWDLRSGKGAHEIAGLHAGQATVASSFSGNTVLTSGRDNLLRVVDTRTFEVMHTLAAPNFVVGGPWSIGALSWDESHVAAGSMDGTVFVWDLHKPGASPLRLRLPGPGPHPPITAAAWSPQGLPLVTASKTGVVTFWQGEE